MLVEALQGILTTDPGMQALLGLPAARPDSTNGVFPVQAPDQPSMPYLVMSQVTGEPMFVTMQGTSAMATERWRFSCYGTTYSNAKKFAKYVRHFLIDILPGNSTAGSIAFSGAYCVMEVDEAEPIGRGTLFSTHVDFNIVYVDNDAPAEPH